MRPHYLSRFFSPKTVAIVGASEREDSVGFRLLLNMQEAGFQGGLYPVNNKRDSVLGLRAYPNLQAIPGHLDLVVVATPAFTVPDIIRQCGDKGVTSVIIITAGFGELGEEGKQLQQQVLAIARQYGIRLIGPNCLGVARPSSNLNATFGDGKINAGNLTLLSQSGAVCTAILDWAKAQDIGFSTVVSMGGAADIDFGEVLDYLATDPATTGILMYVEGIRDARRFLSGLKAAARLKPVILIKSGRHEAGSKAAMSHTGAMVGGDSVFDAAIARAGVVRVYTITELFSAARILANNYTLSDNRLAIITNAGGLGVMATDRAEDVGVTMATLTEASLTALNNVLPQHWSHANPVDILGDATSDRYQQALSVCLADDQVDGILTVLTPQAMTNPTQVAQRIIDIAKTSTKPVLATWTGGAKVQDGRLLFANSSVAHFDTPEIAVDAFSFLTHYTENQILLKQIPAPVSGLPNPDVQGARIVIEGVLAYGRTVLTAQEAKAVLTAFHIPITPTITVGNADEAVASAKNMGFPVVLKLNMAEFSHKSDIGGVRLNIVNAEELRDHYHDMVFAIQAKYPAITSVGMTVEPMFKAANGREIMIGVVRDPVFGPAISVGLGGTMVEILKDSAVALPPLNDYMARQMLARTKAATYLQAFRQMPAANITALVQVLLNVSLMVSELPEILELDINPLIVDEQGAVAVDARIKAQVTDQVNRYSHMAIHPYPYELIKNHQLDNGLNITIRPIRPEDAEMESTFVSRLSEKTKFFRFRQALHELTEDMLVRFTQIDYDREMAFVAVTEAAGMPRELGVVRYIKNPDGLSAEFALVVADDCHCLGIGTRLLATLIQSAIYRGISRLEAQVLAENTGMLALLSKLGFAAEVLVDASLVRVVKELH